MGYIKIPFCFSGDRATIPDTAPPGGEVNYTQGYPINYSKNRLTDPAALNVERLSMNEILYELSLNLQQYQQYSTPNFITTAENGGSPFSYSLGARVRWTDGVFYESIVSSNTSLPTDNTKWKLAGNLTNGNYGAITVTNNGGTFSFSPFSANTVLANATAGSAAPTQVALAANQFLARGASGNLGAFGIGPGFAFVGGNLTYTSTAIPQSVAAGTVNAITATYSPTVTLVDKLLVEVISAGANTVTNPTFSPDSATARTITRDGGLPLNPGDTGSATDVMLLQYNLANTRWDLLNPATPKSGARKVASISLTGLTAAVVTDLVAGSNYNFIIKQAMTSIAGTVGLLMQVSQNNGSTFVTTSSYPYAIVSGGSAATANAAGGTSTGILFGNALAASPNLTYANIVCLDPNNATYNTSALCQLIALIGANTLNINSSGYAGAATADNAIRFILTSGTFGGGVLEVWEIKA